MNSLCYGMLMMAETEFVVGGEMDYLYTFHFTLYQFEIVIKYKVCKIHFKWSEYLTERLQKIFLFKKIVKDIHHSQHNYSSNYNAVQI